MVLFVTEKIVNINDSIDKLCKQIVNIENNLNIYRIDGVMNETPFKKNNIYKYMDVEYDVLSNIGVIIFYVESISGGLPINNGIISAVTSINTIIEMMTHKLIDIDNDVNRIINGHNKYMPFNLNTYKSTNHTLLQNKISNSQGHNSVKSRGFARSQSDLKKLLKRHRFVWLIKDANPNNSYFTTIPFLIVSEYIKYLPKSYLLQSINTIIVDDINLFNVSNGLMQLNYPAIQQYTCFNKNIFDIEITISTKYGIDYEIAKLYMTEITSINKQTSDQYPTIHINSLKMYKIRKPNIDMKWYIQIKEDFNYAEQENKEKYILDNDKYPFRSKLCFVSKMPLYDNIFILDIGKKVIKIKKDSSGNEYNKTQIYNRSYILVNAYIFTALYEYDCVNINFSDYIFKLTGYVILNTILVKYDVSAYKALSYIKNDKNSHILPNYIADKNFQQKKDILLSICKYGIFAESPYYEHEYNMNSQNDNYITINTYTKQIYIGKSKLVDTDVHLFSKTNNIIYKINVLNNDHL
jgi:hypothetical protein